MTLPNWLIQLGSLAGLGTLALTMIGYLFSGRPIVSIRPGSNDARNVYCFNPSKRDILICRVRTWPDWITVASGDALSEVIRAAANMPFSAFLKPEASLDLPLIFKKGELVDRDSVGLAPFIVWVSWRRAESAWMPQIPVVKFSSARSIRRLINIKTGKISS